MSNTLPLSVFIIACNEADRIGSTLASVASWVDDIVVVDSGSTDATIGIAQRFGARVFTRQWTGYGPQKRYGEDQCRHDWTLNLDADEALSPELQTEIQNLFRSGDISRANFWRMAIKDTWPHEEAPASFAYGYNQIRLYRRSIGRFSQSPVHDTVRPPDEAPIGQLKHPVAHRSLRSLAHQIDKLNTYTDAQVADLAQRGRRLPRYRLVTEFPMAFVKAYLVRRYWRYGWWGVIVSLTHAYARFLRVAKSYEMYLRAQKEHSHVGGDSGIYSHRSHSRAQCRPDADANAGKLEGADLP